MKTFTSILMLCLFVSTGLVAQKGNRKQKREKIEALRVSYITNKLQLTPEESKDFWPIYNEYTEERRQLRKSHSSSSQDPEDAVDASFEFEEKQLVLKRNYYSRLKQVVSPKKLMLLEQTEKDFRRKVKKEIARRKEERRKNRQ